MPNDTTQQRKPETNPPLLQIREPLQQSDNFPTNGTILAITRCSNTDFDNKRQLRDYYQQINHVVVEDPITKTKWSNIPITFSAQDINLPLLPHTDATVVAIHTNKWDVTRILIENGSQAEILFISDLKKWATIESNWKSKWSLSMASVAEELSQLAS
jgi:hypothetical protein